MLREIRALTHGWFAWAVIIGLAVVFTLWGVSGYLLSTGNDKIVATVGGQEITQRQVQVVFERMAQQSQVSQLMAGIKNPKLNEKALLNQSIQQLVLETLLKTAASKEGFAMSRQQVDTLLRSMPQFQKDGQFSLDTYERLIRQLNYTPESFRKTVQDEMLIAQVQSTIADSVFILGDQIDNTVALFNQTRDLQYVVFDANDLAKGSNLTEEDLHAYYNANQSEFMSTENVEVSYVLLDKGDIEKDVRANEKPTEKDLRELYDQNMANYSSPERRSASHILLTLSSDATADEIAATKTQAEELYKRLKAGEPFAKLAKDYSKDPTSADQGGSLGYFGRGEMVPEFEKAVFSGQKGELLEPIRTEFGFHIIRIDDVQKAEETPFEKVKSTVEQQWYEEQIVNRYEEESSRLDQMAFENPEDLKAINAEFKLPIQTMQATKDIAKNQGLAQNAIVLQTLFGDAPLSDHQNSELITLSPTQAIVMHINAHNRPALKPFETVENEVRARALLRKGMMMAREKVTDITTKFNLGRPLDEIANQDHFTWTPVQNLNRQNIEISNDIKTMAFSMPVGRKPVLTSGEIYPSKIAVVVIEKVIPGKLDPNFKESMLTEFQQGLLSFIGHRDYIMYVENAKEHIKVDMKK